MFCGSSQRLSVALKFTVTIRIDKFFTNSNIRHKNITDDLRVTEIIKHRKFLLKSHPYEDWSAISFDKEKYYGMLD